MSIVLAGNDRLLRLQLPVGMAGGSILATAHTVETTAEAAGEAGLVAARPTVKGTLKLARKRGYTATSTPLEVSSRFCDMFLTTAIAALGHKRV